MRYLLALLFWLPAIAHAQTRAQILQGRKTLLRSCYDIKYYSLNVQPDFTTRTLAGNVDMHFSQRQVSDSLQLDLFPQLTIDSLTLDGKLVNYRREEGAVLIYTGAKLTPASHHVLTVKYHGRPPQATKPPWGGGLVWKLDSLNRPWLGTAVQGMGASAWWPCKDDVSDKPDSGISIQIDIPNELTAVSNGQRLPTQKLPNGLTRYGYKVSYPINVYNVTLNVGHYAFASDTVKQAIGTPLNMEVAALDYHLPRYVPYLFAEAKLWLASANRWFGPYPFAKDGYRLCETSYVGMEHQSCISYGNHVERNPQGFDFIVVHESGHEYWGNLVTQADPAHFWIHEAFCTYSEALYMEHHHGRLAAQQYLHDYALPRIENTNVMVGPEEVHYDGSYNTDVYFKGALMIETFRNCLNNDRQFFSLLKGILNEFKSKPVTTHLLLDYIDKRTGQNWKPFFEAYLYSKNKPHFTHIKTPKGSRWQTEKKQTMPFALSSKEFKRLVTKTDPLDKVRYYFTYP